MIEDSFSLSPPLQEWLSEQELECDDEEMLLSREWRQKDDRLTGRHRLKRRG